MLFYQLKPLFAVFRKEQLIVLVKDDFQSVAVDLLVVNDQDQLRPLDLLGFDHPFSPLSVFSAVAIKRLSVP